MIDTNPRDQLRFLTSAERPRRIGLIVPSSNTTMETEIPAMLRSRAVVVPQDSFTFHSSRMRMQQVTPDELRRMDEQSDRCAIELADAQCDVLAYACLVAIMAQGNGYHAVSEQRLCNALGGNVNATPVVSSAGALIDALRTIGARRIGLVTPYLKPLTKRVAEYLEHENFDVVDAVSLEVADNVAVGLLDQRNLLDAWRRVDVRSCDALVLSACVQMPSLDVVQEVETMAGIPVVTAATATVFRILSVLGLQTVVPNAGRLLSGAFDGAEAR
jgi:maleate isomerase